MSSSDPETYDLVAQTDAAYRRMLDYWDSKINEASGTFEAVFGDPSQTPFALRVIVYYNEYDESVLELAYESVELGHFEREESFSAHDMTTLKTLIEDALPQLDEAIFNFSRSVCKALLAIDDHPSLMDESIAEYDRLIQLRKSKAANKKIARLNILQAREAQTIAARAVTRKISEAEKAFRERALALQRRAEQEQKNTAYWMARKGLILDPDSGRWVTRSSWEVLAKNKSLVDTSTLPALWRRHFAESGDPKIASSNIRAQSIAAANLMPIFQSQRYPEETSPTVPPWTDEEHALWDYLEIVAIVSQTMFQYPHSGLTRIPLAISYLTCVQEVNLSENKLLFIPIELVSLPNLRRLYLHNNQIKTIPDMSACVSLETLDVRFNSLSDVPIGISACKRLQAFDGEKNKIRDFGELTQCLALDFINLSRNLIRNVPADLVSLTQLHYLKLQNNPVVNLPSHIYIRGMASIMSYLKENTMLVDGEFAVGSMPSDIISSLEECDNLTDLELYATKEDSPLVLSMPYTEEKQIKEIDTFKIAALLKIHEASLSVHPTSVKVHSLFVLARVPQLRNVVRETMMKEQPILSLNISPLDLRKLVRFIYSDSTDSVAPPMLEEVEALASKAPEGLNTQEFETLRHSLVQHWRTRLLAVGTLGKQFGLEYLETLSLKALGGVETSEKTFAKSRFIDDFKSLMPTSESVTVQHDWNTDEAMKHISQGFGELSLQKDGSSPLLRSSSGIKHVPDMSSTGPGVQIDHRHGVKSLAFAPNDIAFRVVDEPGSPLIGAHKLVLCARSKYLRSMLTGGLMESQQVVIDMCDISYDTLRTIVEFCYSDDASDIHGEMIMELLMKARLFGLDRLLGFVESIVGYSLDVTNVSSILSVAYIYSLPRLAKATKFFALSHWSQVTSDPSWQDVEEEVRKKLTLTAIKWGVIGDVVMLEPKAEETKLIEEIAVPPMEHHYTVEIFPIEDIALEASS